MHQRDDAWLILTNRFGGDKRNPAHEDLARAIQELYVEDHPGLEEEDYEEHGSALLRRGVDEGPMVVVEVDRTGTLTLEEWADTDYRSQLAPPRSQSDVPRNVALEAWSSLARGDVDAVRALFTPPS